MVYIKIGSEYVKRIGSTDGRYKLVSSMLEATGYPDRLSAITAVRKSKIDKYKLITSGRARRVM